MGSRERLALILIALGKVSADFMQQSGDVVMPTETMLETAEQIADAWSHEIANIESCIVWLVDNVHAITDCPTSEPSITWPGFELVGDMTAKDIVEAVKRAKETSNGY